MTMKPVIIRNINGRTEPVSGLLIRPRDAKSLLVLAHGAGAGMDHTFMEKLANALASEGVATLRFQFPYWEDGKKRPDTPKLATATVAAAVDWALQAEPQLPLYAGGKSFGGRMTTTAAASGLIPAVKGIVCFGFPLHEAKKPSLDRAAHLQKVKVPILFLQGTRDALAEISLMSDVARELPLATMHRIEGADHGFAVLKRSGRNDQEVIQELAQKTADLVNRNL